MIRASSPVHAASSDAEARPAFTPAPVPPRHDEPPVIELDRIEMRFPGPPEVYALRDATFSVGQGDYVAITGPSGSGKSTAMNVMGLLARPTAGTYRLRGIDVGSLPEKERAGIRGGWIGTIFQAFHLLSDRSAAQNVMMAALYSNPSGLTGKQLVERARECLDQVGLSHRFDANPATMSGGERQRVAIARAMFSRPALLLCDEPTGNLDSHATQDVLTLFDELHDQGQTVIVVTHSDQVAGRAMRRIHILDGVASE